MKNINEFKVLEIGEVFTFNELGINEIDMLISCKYNFSENDLMECEDYKSDGLPFISVLANLNTNNLDIQLSDCYNDMNYAFSEDQLLNIREKSINYINSINR